MGDTNPRFSTGVRFLDREIGGGIPAGDVVTLTVPPDSQGEILFKEVARAQPTLYVSTICDNEAELENRITPSSFSSHDDIASTYVPPSQLLEDPAALVEDIPSDTCIVIDPVNTLEDATQERYLDFINTLKKHLESVDSSGILNCLDSTPAPENRCLTLKRSDHVWQLQQTIESGEISTTLLITKARGNDVPKEAISLELGDEVRIDTSRNIA